MRKYVITWGYWLGTTSAFLALSARALDMFGRNFLDFSTKGNGIGYHSFMDGTLFFFMISIGTASYDAFRSRELAKAPVPKERQRPTELASEESFSIVER